VHWLRFELTGPMRAALRGGTPVAVGCDLPAYEHAVSLSAESRATLLGDFD
jgi:hypothetical protein